MISTLSEYEAIIEKNLNGFYAVGNALYAIRERGLYKELGYTRTNLLYHLKKGKS